MILEYRDTITTVITITITIVKNGEQVLNCLTTGEKNYEP